MQHACEVISNDVTVLTPLILRSPSYTNDLVPFYPVGAHHVPFPSCQVEAEGIIQLVAAEAGQHVQPGPIGRSHQAAAAPPPDRIVAGQR